MFPKLVDGLNLYESEADPMAVALQARLVDGHA